MKNEKTYQIEVNLANEKGLKNRVLYTWCDIYGSQLSEGESFAELRPLISIWLLNHRLIKDLKSFHHNFRIYDKKNKLELSDHFDIHILELPKWDKRPVEDNPGDLWMYFFKQGKELDTDNPPEFLKSKEMEEAMAVLKQFSEKEREYDIYQSRQKAIRLVKTLEDERNEVIKENKKLEKAIDEKDKTIDELKKKLDQSKEN